MFEVGEGKNPGALIGPEMVRQKIREAFNWEKLGRHAPPFVRLVESVGLYNRLTGTTPDARNKSQAGIQEAVDKAYADLGSFNKSRLSVVAEATLVHGQGTQYALARELLDTLTHEGISSGEIPSDDMWELRTVFTMVIFRDEFDKQLWLESSQTLNSVG